LVAPDRRVGHDSYNRYAQEKEQQPRNQRVYTLRQPDRSYFEADAALRPELFTGANIQATAEADDDAFFNNRATGRTEIITPGRRTFFQAKLGLGPGLG